MASAPPAPATPATGAAVRQPQPAGVLTSWIEQLLHKAAGPHAQCLLKVSGELGVRAWGREAERLHDALRLLATALAELDYGLVTHVDGTPHDPPDLDNFAPLYRRVAAALEPVDALAGELEAWVQAHGGGVRRAQVELKMEQERMEEALLRGDGWLAAAWSDLKNRRPTPGDRASIDKLRYLARTADQLGSRLRGLHAAGRAVREACDTAQQVVAVRAALVRRLREDLPPARRAWVLALERLLAAARQAGTARLPVQPLALAEAELRQVLERCLAECARLRQDQRGLQRSLATACEQLRAALQPPAPPAAPAQPAAPPQP
jgi:hypothetical protein